MTSIFLQVIAVQEPDKSTPPKPPAPVLPQKPILRQSARKSLDLSPQKEGVNLQTCFKEIARESILLNVRTKKLFYAPVSHSNQSSNLI